MPGYGQASIFAARGFFRACRDMSRVWKHHPTSSLLASNFNELWCAALNLAHGGERLDYFAMLHDDVAPEDFWLDKLIDELEATGLDMLGVVTPIKDTRGMTSMALDGDDPWMLHCRLSMHDVYALPETFTSEHLGRLLLLNTGCWVIRWNQEICRQLHFEINDRIVFNTAANRYQAQTEPEDWFFSRCGHALGLKIGATRKINLFHVGDIAFPNDRPWGRNTFDVEAVSRSPVPDAVPFEVPGWLSHCEGKALAELARGKRVLEIGSYCGRSTVCLARTAEHVTAVDYFDGRGTPEPRDTRKIFDETLRRHELANVSVHHPDDDLPGEYDVVFIDGAHDYASVMSNIDKALSHLAPGGLIAFHDYRLTPGEHDGGWDGGVSRAVDEFLAAGAELLKRHETLAVVRAPAAVLLET